MFGLETCTHAPYGNHSPNSKGSGAQCTQNLQNSQFCPRMIVIMHEKAMFPLQHNFLVQCSHLPWGAERENLEKIHCIPPCVGPRKKENPRPQMATPKGKTLDP